jgi:hypothetical protein
MKLFSMASPKLGERCGTNMQSIEATNVYNIGSKKGDGVHEHSRIYRVLMVTASICCVLSKYLCGSVSISVSEVGLIGGRCCDL